MTVSTTQLRRRAARAVVFSLLVFLVCVGGRSVAERMAQAALNPPVELESLASTLRQAAVPGVTGILVPSSHEHLLSMPPAADAYQRVLAEVVPRRPEILAAVVVRGDGTILAAYPGREKLGGQNIHRYAPMGPGAPSYMYGKTYPVPGLTADQPDGSGIYPYIRPPSPDELYQTADNYFPTRPEPRGGYGTSAPGEAPPPAVGGYSTAAPGGPYGPPTGDHGGPPGYGPAGKAPGAGEGPSESPIHRTLRELVRQSVPDDKVSLQGKFLFEPLAIVRNQIVHDLFVLPRARQGAYTLANAYLGPAFRLGAVLSFALYWFMLPWWVYLDARPRTEKAVPLAVFVCLTNFLGWLTYLVIRPERERVCPVCVTLLEPGFRICPHCGWSSTARCQQCGRPARSDWRFCPYCEAPRGEAVSPAALE